MELLFLAGDQDSGADRIPAALQGAGYRVRRISRPAEAEHLLHAGADALVADPALADADLLARLRRDCPGRAVIAWIAQPATDWTADLLEAGFEDVLDGAMGPRELAARVAAVARRTESASSTVAFGLLDIDDDAGEAWWSGERIRLTRRERQVLQVLADSAGRTVRRERLYRQVWGYAMARGDRSVDVNVRRLRAKLGSATAGRLEIVTEQGVGYRLELVADSQEVSEIAAVTSL